MDRTRLRVGLGVLACLLLASATVGPAGATSSTPIGPDLSIRTGFSWVGAGIFSASGHRERVDAAVSPLRDAYFEVRISNPTGVARSYVLTGAAAGPAFGVRYQDQSGDQTAALIAGTYTVSVNPHRSAELSVDVTAIDSVSLGDRQTFWVKAGIAGRTRYTDEVRGTVSVPAHRVWSVNYAGTLRCTASFPHWTLMPGSTTDVSFTVTNLTDKKKNVASAGYLVFRGRGGKTLWDTYPSFEGPGPPSESIPAHSSVTLREAFDTRVRWSGTLSITPLCSGLRLPMASGSFPVSRPTPPASVSAAIDAAVNVPGSPFASCHPGPSGEANTGSLSAPDGANVPALTVRCWADVRQERGFDVISLNLVSPSDAPDFAIDEATGFSWGQQLPGTANMEAARWSFVVTADKVTPYISLMESRANGTGSSRFYELHNGIWASGGGGTCGYESFAEAFTGDYFFLDWISACTLSGAGTAAAASTPTYLTIAVPGLPIIHRRIAG